MGVFDRFFGKGRKEGAARTAELRGDLAQAALLYDEAGQPAEAARIMLLRGEGEPDARARLLHFTQAAKVAPEGSVTNKTARLRRAELLLALAGDAAVSAVARHEIVEAAKDLEAIGEPLKAAEAYARAGDKEGEAGALQAAGDVEGLEYLLSTQQHQDRVSRARDDRAKDIDLLIGCGRRREALVALDELLAASAAPIEGGERDSQRNLAEAAALRDRASSLRARKVSAPVVALDIDGTRWLFVLGPEVVVGRTEGSIRVPSNAVSREHLRLVRDGDRVMVRDLESRNGTQLRGVNLAGVLPVGDGLELKLGREVPLRIAPCAALPSAVEIKVAGETYVAVLGPCRLPVPGLSLASGDGGWVELASEGRHVYLGSVELVPHATLLAGDALSLTRGAPPSLRVIGL
jgi:hypothetical protein